MADAGVYFKLFYFIFIWLCRALVGAHEIFGCGMWDPVPWPEIKPEMGPLCWDHEVSATGPSEKSPAVCLTGMRKARMRAKRSQNGQG